VIHLLRPSIKPRLSSFPHGGHGSTASSLGLTGLALANNIVLRYIIGKVTRGRDMNMAGQNESAQELLLDVRVAEASRLYKLYLAHEKKILGTISVAVFLTIWELVGNVFQWINPMFMSSPSLIFKAGYEMFRSGEIYHDLYVSGVEFLGGYFLAAVVGIPFGIMTGWYKRMSYIFDPFVNALNATPRVALLPLVIIWLGIGILS